MTFFAIGLNHLQAPVRERERFALDEETARRLLRDLSLSEDAELLLLSTCNRTEAYGFGTEADVEAVRTGLFERAGGPWPDGMGFAYRSEAAVRHLLEVTAGLRSLVLGDAQIFSQVKEAYRLAVEEDRVGPGLHRLLHTAFRTAKRIINETALSSGAASVPRVAVAAARARADAQPGALTRQRVLLVGAGEMGRQTLEALREDERAVVTVTNRSADRAAALAERFGLATCPWETRHAAAAAADVVIVATGADTPVLTADALPVTADGRTRLLIDISVPRNVDRAVERLEGYEVLDLDTLNDWLVQTEQTRRAAVPAARLICDEMAAEFMTWAFHHQALQPTIQAIRDTFEDIRQQEIERHSHRFTELDRGELDRLTQSIIQKVLAVPVVRLKNVGPHTLDYAQGVRLLHALFARPDCDDAVETTASAALRLALAAGGAPQCPFAEQGAAAPCRAADVAPASPLEALPFRPGATG